MQSIPLYAKLAMLAEGYHNCRTANNKKGADKHETEAKALAQKYLPNGDGFMNGGPFFRLKYSSSTELFFGTAYQVMSAVGESPRPVSFSVSVVGCLARGFLVRVKEDTCGSASWELKDFIRDAFDICLRKSVPHDLSAGGAARRKGM